MCKDKVRPLCLLYTCGGVSIFLWLLVQVAVLGRLPVDTILMKRGRKIARDADRIFFRAIDKIQKTNPSKHSRIISRFNKTTISKLRMRELSTRRELGSPKEKKAVLTRGQSSSNNANYTKGTLYRVCSTESQCRSPVKSYGIAHWNGHTGAYSITLDDGSDSMITYGAAILNKYRLPGTFFLCPQFLDPPKDFPKPKPLENKWEIMNKAYSLPTKHEIGAHTNSHRDFEKMRAGPGVIRCQIKL